MNSRPRLFTLFVGLSLIPLVSGWAVSEAKTPQIPNFALLDHEGRFHELDYLCREPDTKGIVLFIQGNGCPLVQKRIPELNRLRDHYGEQGITFVMLNANLQDDREEIQEEAKSFAIDFPIMLDESQMVARALGVKGTAEALVIDAKTQAIHYRGAIDDRLSVQKEKPEAKNHYLRDALDALLAGKAAKTAQTEAPGCKITFDASVADRSYSEHIAPILKQRCVTCHSKGGIGPFAMSNHQKIKGWSEMIEEVVLARQMPPWHADPHIGQFKEDQGLKPEETAQLLSWIRAGSPRGEGPDPLDGYLPERVEWRLGKPDHIMELPEQEVPAEGVLPYRYVHMETPFDEDVWLRGFEVNPGNRQVLHHVVVTGAPKDGNRRNGKWFTGYAPGTAAWPTPPGTGIKLPKGYVLRFQLHYTSSGKPETDKTRIGFYLAKEEVKKELHTRVIIHPRFQIPPHNPEYTQEVTKDIRDDVTIYGMNPHMHYRGKRMSFHAVLPDGTESDVLSVPNYNFNWQRTYALQEPMRLPKGSKMIIRNAWDNSELNPHNPDPNKAVRWGEQSFEEMFFATYSYTID